MCVKLRIGCGNNPSDESIFNGLCDDCRDEEIFVFLLEKKSNPRLVLIELCFLQGLALLKRCRCDHKINIKKVMVLRNKARRSRLISQRSV